MNCGFRDEALGANIEERYLFLVPGIGVGLG